MPFKEGTRQWKPSELEPQACWRTKGSFSSLSSITALAVFFSRGGRALSAAKVCF